MLPNEIEPFADHHIEELEAIARLLRETRDDDEIVIPEIYIDAAMDRVSNAQEAFRRFKVCMADEVRQKVLYRDRWLELRNKNKKS